MPYFTILIIAAFAAFYYRAAEFENESTLTWCGLSLAISMVMLLWLHAGWLWIILGQTGLFVGITLVRILRKS
jgi:hypothetical protein